MAVGDCPTYHLHLVLWTILFTHVFLCAFCGGKQALSLEPDNSDGLEDSLSAVRMEGRVKVSTDGAPTSTYVQLKGQSLFVYTSQENVSASQFISSLEN